VISYILGAPDEAEATRELVSALDGACGESA